MSKPFQVVVQTDLDIAPPSMDSVPEPFPDKVLMGQISAPLGLRSSSPAALDVGDIARKLYLMAFEANNVSLQIRSFWTDWSGHEVRFPKPTSCTTFRRPVDILALFVESGQTQCLKQWGYYYSPTGGHKRGIGCDPTGYCCRRDSMLQEASMTK
jgi:hypothetical protein